MITLEHIETDLYRAPPPGPQWPRIFGGQLLGEAVMAASETVASTRPAHSLHAYFFRPGDPLAAIDYRVSRLRDGTSFSARHVEAHQMGRQLLALTASFHERETGLTHQRSAMPDVPPPEALADERSLLIDRLDDVAEERRLHILRKRPIEFRPVDPQRWPVNDPRDPVQAYWIRLVHPIGAMSPALQRALFTYASDHLLLSTGLIAHGVDWLQTDIREASLDHSIWFHADPTMEDWSLYVMDGVWAGSARMVNHGQLFGRDGALIATVAQEGLIRLA